MQATCGRHNATLTEAGTHREESADIKGKREMLSLRSPACRSCSLFRRARALPWLRRSFSVHTQLVQRLHENAMALPGKAAVMSSRNGECTTTYTKLSHSAALLSDVVHAQATLGHNVAVLCRWRVLGL